MVNPKEEMTSLIVRTATAKDAERILKLVKALAIYEKKKPDEIKLTLDKILSHGFERDCYFHILVTEINHVIVGYALYFFTYSASAGAPILYLEDLFVLEEYRNRGIGKKLLRELSEIAMEKQCCRMEWHVYTWNESAVNFYRSIGAVIKTDLMQVRLENEPKIF